MTDQQQLYRIPVRRSASADALRTLSLILATVLIGLAVIAAVPDETWQDLMTERATELPEWHGNVSVQQIRH